MNAIIENSPKYGRTINLTPERERYAFRIGEAKARVVLERIEEIRHFVEVCDRAQEQADQARAEVRAEQACGIA